MCAFDSILYWPVVLGLVRPDSRASRLSTTSRFSVGRIPVLATVTKKIIEDIPAQEKLIAVLASQYAALAKHEKGVKGR